MLASATTFGGMALAMARVFGVLVIATVVVILAALFRKFSVVGTRVAVAVTVHWFVHACSRNGHLVTLGVNCTLLRVVTTTEGVGRVGVDYETVLLSNTAVVLFPDTRVVGIVQVREMAGAERDVVKTLELRLEASRLLLNLPELSLGLLQELNIGRVFGLCCQGRHLCAELPLGEHVCMVLTLNSIHLPRFHAGGRLQLSILQHLGGYRQLCHARLLVFLGERVKHLLLFRKFLRLHLHVLFGSGGRMHRNHEN
mmetsp:Transcript_49999/g.80678  ORF Transcript_49999/g.80678 Transcript_49999/m.80678 type:complete len:255 (-) Transcript_49999:61-825(-)